MNQENIQKVLQLDEADILKQIEELRKHISPGLLKNIQSRNVFQKKVKKQNPLDGTTKHSMDFFNEELKKEDVIARNLTQPKESLGIFTDFIFDQNGALVGQTKE